MPGKLGDQSGCEAQAPVCWIHGTRHRIEEWVKIGETLRSPVIKVIHFLSNWVQTVFEPTLRETLLKEETNSRNREEL